VIVEIPAGTCRFRHTAPAGNQKVAWWFGTDSPMGTVALNPHEGRTVDSDDA
jgi:hypothetical protein